MLCSQYFFLHRESLFIYLLCLSVLRTVVGQLRHAIKRLRHGRVFRSQYMHARSENIPVKCLCDTQFALSALSLSSVHICQVVNRSKKIRMFDSQGLFADALRLLKKLLCFCISFMLYTLILCVLTLQVEKLSQCIEDASRQW